MKNLINNIKKNYPSMIIILLIGFALGWLFFHNSKSENNANPQTKEEVHNHSAEETEVWTCSMHPQIRSDKPGKCPICSMDLIPLQKTSDSDAEETDTEALVLSESAAKLAQVETITVKKGQPTKEVFLQGKVFADERNIAELTARYGGRIEKLFVNFTGQNVRKGQRLATIYSQALISAQKELLEAISFKESRPNLYKASRSKLKLWNLTDNQIDNIEDSGEPILYFDVLSPISGTVMDRHVAMGDYVKEGTPLFKLIDLSKVWVMFDAYESDLPWIKLNDKVSFRLQSIPDKKYEAKVTYIDPFIDPQTRAAKVRVEVNNNDKLLKPEMFVNGYLVSEIANNTDEILIPKSSVLWTGRRAIVYVKLPDSENSFKYREVTLGPEAGNFYVISDGLKEGEEIVVNGVFKIDAASQLQGLKSMMNPEGGAGSTPHDMSKMDMSNTEQSKTSELYKTKDYKVNPDKISDKFKSQLTEVYNAYIAMKDAFVKSDVKLSTEKAQSLKLAINNTDMSLLKGDAHLLWMEKMNEMKSLINNILSQKNLEKQRFEFSKLSLVFYDTVKKFGLVNKTVYYQFCPMANENGGAYWLSDDKEILNPYFGDMMLNCGEVRETIK